MSESRNSQSSTEIIKLFSVATGDGGLCGCALYLIHGNREMEENFVAWEVVHLKVSIRVPACLHKHAIRVEGA